MTSPDLTEANIAKIATLFPNVATEAVNSDGSLRRVIDFDLLRQELSDHLVEGPQERYRLDWPGKRAATLAANAPIAKTLRPVRAESVDFDATSNLFIEGDNLEALKLLQESYLGKIKLIYIDPPYNTGNDFVYEDDFAESSAEYLTRSGQKSETGERFVANTEANGRFHSDWLNMMYPRLRLARNLLTDDGFIFISIGDTEQASLKRICDEIFGESNYVTSIMWRRKRETSNDSKNVSVQGEFVLVYSRSNEASLSLEPLSEEYVASAYREPTEEFPDGRWRGVPITVSKGLRGGGYQYTVTTPSGNEITRVWAYPKASFDKLASSGRLYWGMAGDGVPQRVVYAHESAGQPTTNYWSSTGSNKEGKKVILDLFGDAVFDTVKPLSLIQRIIGLATKSDSIVLDFFAGSATTAHAVMVANALDGGSRRFIMVQLDEPVRAGSVADQNGYSSIADISKERIRRAGAQLNEELLNETLDIGFRALKIDSTNIVDMLATADDWAQESLTAGVESVKPDRSDEDLLFQVLLDWGLSLTETITVQQIAGQRVMAVSDDALIACFGSSLSEDIFQLIAARRPLRAVFLDAGFPTDAARINAEQIFREVSPETEIRTI